MTRYIRTGRIYKGDERHTGPLEPDTWYFVEIEWHRGNRPTVSTEAKHIHTEYHRRRR